MVFFEIHQMFKGHYLNKLRVSFNPYVGPLPRIKMFFPLLSKYSDKLISTPEIQTSFYIMLFY